MFCTEPWSFWIGKIKAADRPHPFEAGAGSKKRGIHMGVTGGLIAMWALYIAFGIFPIIYVSMKGRKEK